MYERSYFVGSTRRLGYPEGTFMKFCILGGTRFIGKILVDDLLAAGHDVTLITRGRTKDSFGDSVTRLQADANDPAALSEAVAGLHFDAVIHQVCYGPGAAIAAAEAFGDRVGKIILTSTIEVYNASSFNGNVPLPPLSGIALEAELNTSGYGYDTEQPWHDWEYIKLNYAEGKRQAESAMLQHAKVPVVIPRVAHVLAATDDFTGRFQFHYERITKQTPIVTHVEPGVTSLVLADDVAKFLGLAATGDFVGVFNVASPDPVSVYDVIGEIEKATGHQAVVNEVAEPQEEDNASPYSFPVDFAMSNQKATQAGATFKATTEWLPKLARSY